MGWVTGRTPADELLDAGFLYVSDVIANLDEYDKDDEDTEAPPANAARGFQRGVRVGIKQASTTRKETRCTSVEACLHSSSSSCC